MAISVVPFGEANQRDNWKLWIWEGKLLLWNVENNKLIYNLKWVMLNGFGLWVNFKEIGGISKIDSLILAVQEKEMS